MAGGGKESPRQRMIGMMYLVLTALLALQVQNEVLEKFYFIDKSLQSAKDISLDTNKKIIESMVGQAKETGNNAKDLAFITKANQIKERTKVMLDEVNKIRDAVKTAGGEVNPETGRYAKDKDYDDINRIMLGEGESKTGFAWKLQEQMNTYAKDILAIDTKNLEGKIQIPLAPDRKDMKEYASSKYDNMEWQHINFQNTPMIAALAVISQLENDIVKVETSAINEMQKQIGTFQIKFDKVQAMASAESNVVAAGTKYKAKMFISATSTTLSPKMVANGSGVRTDGEGVGLVEFTASGGTVEGAKKTWQGAITIKNAAGEDTTLLVKQDYTVVSPVIEVESGTVNSLYLKCGNDLKVKVPALGVEYNPSFNATGGSVMNGSGGKGSIIIVPNSAKVTLSVASGGNPIGTKTFNVKMIPKPEIKAKGLNLKQGGACPRSITMDAIADASFRDQLPKDARYRVTSYTVTLARGRRVVGSPVSSNGPTVDISSLGQQAKEGDRLVIEVKGVQRMNFQNQTESVNIGTGEIINYSISQ